MCGGGSRGDAVPASSNQASEEYRAQKKITGFLRAPGAGDPAGVRACAESTWDCSGLCGAGARSRSALARGGLRQAGSVAARVRGRSCAARTALALCAPLLPVTLALPTPRQSPPRPLPRLARSGGAMAAYSKYLTARNSSLAGAAFLVLCLLHKRRRALGLRG